ncbi:MAG TPA: BTAD domain-containing putative transcriptional regulator [Acidimicrobiales bacterium]|nr:BTAD domain-containing putative transcriptional regulator [Acidimicrobiales bacterium]
MPRPYRYAPARPGRPLIRRSALLRRLNKRWDRQITVIVAGAGFGKSALLAQALDENALAPRGVDCWLGCGPGDDDARRLAAGLADSLGADLPHLHQPGDLDPDALGALLAGDLWRWSPRQVCLVLDDVHEIGRDSSGAAVLAGLVNNLPSNGHVVLSGRTDPPLPLARLEAQGWVERLGECDMAFGDDELSSFATLRGMPRDRLTDLGGWPALAELRTAGARDAVDDFLAEEVMAALTRADRRVVATVAALGGADQTLVDTVLGGRIPLAALMARLPLVSCDDHGWFAIHPVWSEALSRHLDEAERQQVQRQAGLALATRDIRQAAELLVAAGAHDDLRAVLRTGCRAHVLSAFSGVTRLYASLPDSVRSAPEGQLVAGVAASTTDVDRAVDLLSTAARRFAEDGERVGLLTALEHLAMYAHWREDVELFGTLWDYAQQVDGLPEARGVIALGNALIADTLGDARGVLSALDSLDVDDVAPYWRATVTWLRATSELALGFAEAARRNAELAVSQASPALRGALAMLQVNALEACGDFDRAREVLQRMLDELDRSGNDHTRGVGYAIAAARAAFAGAVDEADRLILLAHQCGGKSPLPSLVATMRLSEAGIAVARGDEGAAAALLARAVDGHKVSEGRQFFNHLRRLPLLYVLVPDTRDEFEALDVGPCYRPALRLAQALVALRERGDLGPAAGLRGQDWAVAPAFLPTVWTVELATGAAAGGQSGAETRVADAGPAARTTLLALTDRSGAPKALRTWARTLLDSVPPEPGAPLALSVLGPTTLQRAGRTVDHPHWRRERVRALLLLLLARGGGTREELAGALWPDLDTSSALRNLRVTLSYLLAVLEPDRREGAPSFFVRTDGATLRLTTHGWLAVDARQLEDCFDRAGEAERAGEPSAALDLYRRGIGLYRGAYLTDAGYEEWALPHRDRLSARFVAAAVRAGELTLAAGDPDEALRLAARALESEPWSEPAHRLMVASHLARGDRAAARRAMNTCLAQLADLGVPPTEDTEVVLRAIA